MSTDAVRLERLTRTLRISYKTEMGFRVLFISALLYFVYGHFSVGLLPWREVLWSKPLALTFGVVSALGYTFICGVHLAFYAVLKDAFLAYSTGVDQQYTKQGFKRVPDHLTDLIARCSEYLKPRFLPGEKGLRLHVLGGIIGVGVSFLLSWKIPD